MDVTLPNGVVVKGIPDNTSKQELATKLKANGMDVPKEWMASTGPKDLGPFGTQGQPQPPVQAPDTRPAWDPMRLAKNYITDPVIGVVEAGLAPFGYEPRTRQGQAIVNAVPYGVKDTGEKILQGFGPAESALVQGPQMIGRGATIAGKNIAALGSDLSDLNQEVGGVKALGKIVPPSIKPSAIYGKLTGATKAAEAEELAAGKSRELVQGALKSEESTIQQMNRINAKLADRMKSPVVPSLDEQGDLIKDVVANTLTPVRQNIKSEASKLYSAADQEASQLEQAGKFVDTKPVITQINSLLKRYEDEPAITGKLNSIKSMILGSESTSAPKLAPATGMRGIPAITESEKTGRAYLNLKDAKEMLQELGYANPLEGYSRLFTKSARDITDTLDEQIGKFSPKYAEATKGYEKLMAPLDFLNSKFGKMLEGTEGGFKKNAFDVTKSQDLPGKIFSKKENVESLVEALAGGRGASKEAKATAQLQVNKLAEDYLRKSFTQKTAEVNLASLKAPQMEATLKATPKVAEKLTSELTKRSSQEQLAKTLATSSEEKTKMLAAFNNKITEADALAALPGDKSKQQALSSYNNLLREGFKKGLITKDQLDTSLQLIDNAQTLNDKAMESQKIIKWIASAIGFGAVEETVRRNIF